VVEILDRFLSQRVAPVAMHFTPEVLAARVDFEAAYSIFIGSYPVLKYLNAFLYDWRTIENLNAEFEELALQLGRRFTS
jgi:hypothetical protein